jgi:hypothetical protein
MQEFVSSYFGRWHLGDLVFATGRRTLVKCQTPHPSRRLGHPAVLPQRCSMELALFVVVVIVAGAVIPGDSKIRFYR